MSDVPATPRIVLTAEGGVEQVALIGRAVQAVCGLTPLAQDALDEIELGVVEAVTNVFEHSFGGAGSVEVTVILRGDRIRIELQDRGRPMDPALLDTASLEFDPDDLEALPQSGMGLHLIRATFDDVSYTSGEGVNRLCLEKRIAPQ